MIYPKNFEQKTGFDKIREMIKSHCMSGLGKWKVDEMFFYTNFKTIETQINRTEEFKQILLTGKEFPQDGYYDLRTALKKIETLNTYLTVSELFQLKKGMDSMVKITSFFKREDSSQFLFLKFLCQDIEIPRPIIQKINNILNEIGEVKDSASPELKQIRNQITSKRASVSGVVSRLLRTAKAQGWTEPDAEITLRDGKMLIPVQSGAKRKLQGIVADESASGKTSFIEPLESVELSNAIRELEFAEKREIIKILTEITNLVRPEIPNLANAYNILAELDFARAKALFAIDNNCEKPNIKQTPECDFINAKHPVLSLTLKNEGRNVVPLDIQLNQTDRIIMISGPNAGGKSVCLKTAGIIQYMHQCGILIPASCHSSVGIFNDIFIDIGDEQSIENDLSTYSGHLTNMKVFLDNATDKSLILIDEFGSGTEPILGGAIAEAVLESLNEKHVKGIITTHYTNLKNYATSTPGLINGAMLYDSSDMKPLFTLQTGKTGNSFAFEIAQKTGLSTKILKKAEEIAGREHIDYERRIQELEEDARKIKLRMQSLDAKEKNLERLEHQAAVEMEITLSERKNILKAVKEQAAEILKSANKKIENTILSIKQANAEKEPTKQIRKEFEQFKQETEKKINEDEKLIDKKIERLKQKQKEKAERRRQKREQKAELQNQKTIKPLEVGDKVLLDGQGSPLKILAIKDNKALVALGHMQTFVDTNRLTAVENVGKKDEPKVNVTIKSEKKSGSFLFGLDVRGLRGDQAVERVAKYIDEALAAGATEIKILHGTGNGILRSLIRDYLSTQNIIKNFHDEKIDLGGAGITVATIDSY